MAYIFAIHIPIAGLALVPMLFALPPLLMPLHIALLELVVDPSCSIAFENEPAEPQVMQCPPRDVHAPIFGFRQMWGSFFQGLCVLAATGAAYWQTMGCSVQVQRAMVLLTLVTANAMLIFVNRARNPVALGIMALAMALAMASVYSPWLAVPLGLAHLSVPQAMTALAFGVGSMVAAWLCLNWLRYDQSFKGAKHG